MTWLARWLVGRVGIVASAALVSGMAKAGEYELTYDLILNQGSAPYASLQSSGALPAGTQVKITATFDTDTADQWNTGAWIYDATIGIIEIEATGAPPVFYTASPARQYDALLSDPSWQTVGGPGPYSVGLFYIGGGSPYSGSLNSVFGLASQPFEAATPSDTSFSDYNASFYFAGSPLVLDIADAATHSPDVLSIFDNSVSDATATIA